MQSNHNRRHFSSRFLTFQTRRKHDPRKRTRKSVHLEALERRALMTTTTGVESSPAEEVETQLVDSFDTPPATNQHPPAEGDQAPPTSPNSDNPARDTTITDTGVNNNVGSVDDERVEESTAETETAGNPQFEADLAENQAADDQPVENQTEDNALDNGQSPDEVMQRDQQTGDRLDGERPDDDHLDNRADGEIDLESPIDTPANSMEVYVDEATGHTWVIDDDSVEIYDRDANKLSSVRNLRDPEIIQGEDGKFWIVDENNVIYLDADGKRLAHVENTDGRAEVVRGEDGAWWVVDESSVHCFDKDGKHIGSVRNLNDPEIIPGEDGKFWIVDENNVIYLDADGKRLAHVENTDGRAEVVRGEDGAWWVVDESSVHCFDKDGKHIGSVRNLNDPEIIQGEDGKFWIVDENNVIYLDAEGNVLRRVRTVAHRGGIMPLPNGAWCLLDGGNVAACFDQDGNHIADLGGSQIVGDFDNDTRVTPADVELLSQAVAQNRNNPRFDVNEDGMVNAADLQHLVTHSFHTTAGDANLDGVFDTQDLVQVFQAGQYEDDTANNSTWATGDWNGDGEFDTTDLVLAFRAGTFEASPPSAALVAVRGRTRDDSHSNGNRSESHSPGRQPDPADEQQVGELSLKRVAVEAAFDDETENRSLDSLHIHADRDSVDEAILDSLVFATTR